MARYTTIPVIKSPDDKQIYQTVRYPEIPRTENDIYVFTTIGDRYCLLYTSPSPRDRTRSRMPSSA